MTKSRNLLAMASALVVAFITFSHAADDDLTVADLKRMMVDLSNWGRWGADHQLGTLNLITAEKRIQAAGLVKLEVWEQQIGIRVGSGDAVLLRTGRWARREALGAWDPGQGFAGFHASAVAWLKQRDVAIVGTDAGLDVSPSGMEGEG